MVEAESALVVQAFEKKIDNLQQQKRILEEKRGGSGQKLRPFDEMYRTSMLILSNPLKIWNKGSFELRRAVLKLAFSAPLLYDRKNGYRTPGLSLPFKLLEDLCMQEKLMVPGSGLEPARDIIPRDFKS